MKLIEEIRRNKTRYPYYDLFEESFISKFN